MSWKLKIKRSDDFFLQIWGFCKIKFCSKFDVNLDSDVPQKPTIAHWKEFSISILPNKSKVWETKSKSRCKQKYLYNFFCNTLYINFELLKCITMVSLYTAPAKKIHPFDSVWYEIGVLWPNIKPNKSNTTDLGF